MAATGLTVGTLCDTGAVAIGNGRNRGLVGAGIARMERWPSNVIGAWFTAGVVAARAAAGGCGSAVAAGACIYLPDAGAGAGANASAGVVLIVTLPPSTRSGACVPSGGGCVASRYVP